MRVLSFAAIAFVFISVSIGNLRAADTAVTGKDKYKTIQGKRYKVGVRKDGRPEMDEINPVPQTSGIKTGFVVIYGHVVKPPYNLTVDKDKMFLNAVPVGAMATEKGILAAKANDLVEKAKGIFCSDGDKKAAQGEINKLFEANKDIGEVIKWLPYDTPGNQVLIVKWQQGAHQMDVQFHQGACNLQANRSDSKQQAVGSARETDTANQAKTLRKSLENGNIVDFDMAGGATVLPIASKDNISNTLKDLTLTREVLLSRLEGLGLPRRGALDLIFNYAETDW